MRIKYLLILPLLLSSIGIVFSQQEYYNNNKFRQLGQELPTPNVYRTGSGAPGHLYWQQQADYEISVELDDEKQSISGKETITYTNNSPDALAYLWVQLDQNMRALDSDTYKIKSGEINNDVQPWRIKSLEPTFDGGFKLDYVQDGNGKPIEYTIVKTMMRINLPTALQPKEQTQLKIKWSYNINDRMKMGGRSGYEYFPEDGNYLYTIAQFFPRMAVYIDNEGWQNKQFLGAGEFTLPFGNYDVSITVPADHKVAATGVLQNPKQVLSKTEQKRFEEAKKEKVNPVIIVTEEEAIENEKEASSSSSTWHFKAKNVRDFAFASSRKFIWDAMAVQQTDGSTVMAMSMYPKEGNPLWEKYSTKTVAHTLKWYSHYTFPYPYPAAWSIHAAHIGMEYPMICFNFGRPETDGTYSKATKYGMISVIIHEVGHNYFPMIVNSDERQWTWMDEGLNTFLQYLTEQQWERNYPSKRGPAPKIIPYMSGAKEGITPIMTNSESILQFGNNAYGKPATALNILRETVMGRDNFDYAFKTYSQRWMFKHPSPADFFRTMEDASAVDLDWFWRGWFYTTEHVDIALTDVKWYKINTNDPIVENPIAKKDQENRAVTISKIRNKEQIKQTQDEIDTSLVDFYTNYDPLEVSVVDKEDYKDFLSGLSVNQLEMLQADKNYYQLSFENRGGLVMPIIIQLKFSDGTQKDHYIPAEIWRKNHHEVSKVLVSEKEVVEVIIDPYQETADTDTSNNYYPPRQQMNRFELFRMQKSNPGENPIQRDRRAKEMDD